MSDGSEFLVVANPPDHLYLIQSNVTGSVKIGRSKDPQSRLKALQTGSPYQLKLLAVLEGMGHRERGIHEDLSFFRLRKVKGEWFHPDCIPNLPLWVYDQLPFDERWWVPKSGSPR